MLPSGIRFLVSCDDRDQKRLQQEFDDRRIRFGFNQKNKRYEAWYVPDTSRPYMITSCIDVTHAIAILRGRQKNDKIRARKLLGEIDEHNERIQKHMQADAMYAVKSELRAIASGRQFFTP